MIRVRCLATYHGPSPVSKEPVLLVELVLESEVEDRLMKALEVIQMETSGWYEKRQILVNAPLAQKLGGFLTDWALQALVFVRGFLRASGCVPTSEKSRALLWLGYHDAQLSLGALKLGVHWINALMQQNRLPDFDYEITQFWQKCRALHPDYQACIVMEAAQFRGIPIAKAWGQPRHWRYGQGARSRVLFESSSSEDGYLGGCVSSSKIMTKNALLAMGLPTPKFKLVMEVGEIQTAVDQVRFPCVIKPSDQGGGKGVSAGLSNLDSVLQAFNSARIFSKGPILLEAHVPGDDYRLMVMDGRFVAAIRREPPSVLGDGINTINALVTAQNMERDARSLSKSGFKRPILLDPYASAQLASQGMTPDSVPDVGSVVQLRSNANLSTGGSCIDCSQSVHPEIRTMVETIALTLNIQMLGVDYLTTDISCSPSLSGGQFIEINTTPGLDAMIAAGWSATHAGDLALGASVGRVSIGLIVVNQENLATTQAILRERPWAYGHGWAGFVHLGLSGTTLSAQTKIPWAGVQALLGHKSLSAAVIVASDQEIERHGLPLDAIKMAYVECELKPAWQRVLDSCCQTVVHQGPGLLGHAQLDKLLQDMSEN